MLMTTCVESLRILRWCYVRKKKFFLTHVLCDNIFLFYTSSMHYEVNEDIEKKRENFFRIFLKHTI